MEYIKSVSKTIAYIAGIEVRFGILFPQDRATPTVSTWQKQVDENTEINISIDIPTFLSIRLVGEPGTLKKDCPRFTLPQRYLKFFCLKMEKFIKLYKGDDIFYLEDRELKMYELVPEKHFVNIDMGETHVQFQPVVINTDGNQYEGCSIMLNKQANVTYLTFQELLALYDCISRVDPFIYSQLLLNYIAFNPYDKKIEKKMESITERLYRLESNYKTKINWFEEKKIGDGKNEQKS